MSLVLAVHEDTNANASVVRDGEIVAAVAEERLSRQKFQGGFPERAVDACLALAGVTFGDLDGVVAGNRYHVLPRLLGAGVIAGEHDLFGPEHKAWVALQARFHQGGPLARGVEALNRRLLARRFGRGVPIVDHHSAHCASAYLTSDFDDALGVTIDNFGDGFSARVFDCRAGRCEPLWGSDAVHSPGQFYGEITQLLGFRVLDAGKVTGLSARGDAARAYPLMERLIRLRPDQRAFELPGALTRSRKRGVFAELAGHSRDDICAAAQQRLEDVVVAFVQHALQETRRRHLVLAGGVFANVLVNQRLWALPEVDGLFVHPAMNDQGISAGAALHWQGAVEGGRGAPLDHVYLGTEVTEASAGRALEIAGIRATRPNDLDAAVVEHLVAGRIVARVSGRMEYGLRALGHRSILGRASDETLPGRLNARLERSEFMPFAPATAVEHAERCYRGYGPGIARTARYMTVSLDTTDALQAVCPAVVHVDGTARPQVVHPEPDPGYHRILRLFEEATGEPAVLNTSFNVHGEPIVASAEDALRVFERGAIDVMALGPFLVERPYS